MSAVSATAFTALRVRVAASRLARSRVSGQGLGTTKSLLLSPAVRTHATTGTPNAASANMFPHPRLLSRLSRLAGSYRVPVPRAAPSDDAGDKSSGTTETSSDRTNEIPVSFSADEEAFGQASGEGNCEDYDVVTDKVDLNKANNIVADAKQATGQPGWFSKPEISKNTNEKDPSAYIGGDVGYSKFYPPEARYYAYKRRVMVAVDGSVESEQAVRWAIQHICRSGDLLHIVHCAISIDPRLATFYGPLGDQISISGDANPYSKKHPWYQIDGTKFVAYPGEIHKRPMYDDSWAPVPPEHLKQIRAEYFSAAVLRTEAMLDDVYKSLQHDHGKTFLVSPSSRDYFITMLDKTYKTTNLPTGIRGFCGGSLAGELADGGVDMTPFPQPIELDAILETNWEPIADMVKRRATEVDAEMLIVAHHSKKWWEEALVGSVTKYLIDHSDLNVVVVH